MGILGLPGLDYVFRRGWLHFFFMLFLARIVFSAIDQVMKLSFGADFWIAVLVLTFWWAREKVVWGIPAKKNIKIAGLVSGVIIILFELVALLGTSSGNLSYAWLPGYLLFDWFFYKYIKVLRAKN